MKDLSSVTVVGSGHVLTASIFFGSVDIPFSDTTWPKYSTSLANSRHFLGLSLIGFCSYYRRFIEGFADIAKPLHKLTQKGKLFVWTDECQVSFDQLIKTSPGSKCGLWAVFWVALYLPVPRT
jgi:hypothetical protein